MWGTHIDNGVEVYNKQFTIWPGTSDENVGRVLKLFGIKTADINNQSKKGITRLYLYFNPNKIDTSSYSKEALATMLETDVPFGEWREFTLTYFDRSDPMKFKGWSKQQIQAFVESNITTVTSSGVTSTQDLDEENIDNVIGSYIIAEAGVDFEKVLIDAAVVAVPSDGSDSTISKTASYSSGITLRYRYRRIGYLDDASPIVVDMYEDLVAEITKASEDSVELSTLRGKLANTGKTDTIWYNGKIRVEASKTLRKHDYANLMFGSLDSGYVKKKSKGWLKILAVVIIVVVTYLTWNPGAGLAAGAAITASSALTAVAITAAAVTLALTVYSYVLSRYGETGSAEYVGRWIKVTGIIATVAGITAALTSLMQRAGQIALEEGAKTAAAGSIESAALSGVTVEIAGTTAAENVVVEVSAGNVMDAAMSMVSDSFGSSTSWLSKLSTASKVVNPIMDWRQKNQQEELTSLSDEYKKQQEALIDEYDKNLHIGLEDIKMYSKPLTVANVQFETDYQYEPTKFNIQRASFVRSGMNIIS